MENDGSRESGHKPLIICAESRDAQGTGRRVTRGSQGRSGVEKPRMDKRTRLRLG